jgi:ATP-dependent DNA helicase DinG
MEPLPPRGTRYRALTLPAVGDGFDVVTDSLSALEDALAPLATTSPGFDACTARTRDLRERLQRWRDGDAGSGSDAFASGEEDGEAVVEAVAAAGAARAEAIDSAELSAAAARGGEVYWYELSPRGFRCQRTPLDVSAPLRAQRERSHAAWIFTSATLAVGGGFQHIGRKLGLFDPETLLEPSPFDWPRQALCYLPRNLPEPNTRDFGAAMLDVVRPVLEASGGRAFLLFASHRALREAAASLRGGPWPLFVQGEAPKAELLRRFRESGNGVLLGSASFREGVDVAGDALSVVVVDKLPFAAPDDPVFEARLEAVRRRGGNPFRDEQLPQAVIALKQGVGRLIRTESDRGVLVLCDPRLTGKPYGRVFMQSLPAFTVTRRIEEVQAFFGAGT